MALDILVTTDRLKTDPVGRSLVEYVRDQATSLRLDKATMYYDFPTYADYETVTYKPDVLVLSMLHGIVPIRFFSADTEATEGSSLTDVDESLAQFCSILIGRLLKSKLLRVGMSRLISRLRHWYLFMEI